MAANQKKDPTQIYEELNSLYKARKYDELLTSIDAFLKEDPSHEFLALYKLGILLRRKKFQEALETIDKTTKKAELYLETAYCLFKLGQGEKAAELLMKSMKKEIKGLHLLGQINYKRGDFKQAIGYYTQMETIEEGKKDWENTVLNLSSAYIQWRRYPKILIEPKHLKLLQSSSDGLLNLSIAYAEDGAYEKAFSTLKAGFAMRLKEEPKIEAMNDFQLQYYALLPKLIGYDGSPEMKVLLNAYKAAIKASTDDETKLILINNRVALDRSLSADACIKSLLEINLAGVSSHEMTIRINLASNYIRMNKIPEARAQLDIVERQSQTDNSPLSLLDSLQDERYFVLKAYLLVLEKKDIQAVEYLKQFTAFTEKSENKRALLTIQLYLAQLYLVAADYKNCLAALESTFHIQPSLILNQDYFIFVCNIMKTMSSKIPQAKEHMVAILDLLQKTLISAKSEDKDFVPLAAYAADLAVTLGREAYGIANKLYEKVVKAGDRKAEMGFIFTKCILDGDADGMLNTRLGEMKYDFDEDYKRKLVL